LAGNWAVGKNGRLKAGSIFGRLFLPEFPLAPAPNFAKFNNKITRKW